MDSDTEARDDNMSQMVRLLGHVKRDKEKDVIMERTHSDHDGFKVVMNISGEEVEG